MLSSDTIRNIFIILYSVFMPIEAWSADVSLTKPIEIRMEAEIPVSGDKIVLGDVATIYSKNIHDFQALSSLVIGQVPNDTKELKMPLSYLRARIKEALPSAAEFSVSAPVEVKFKLEKFGVSSQELAQEIIKLGKEKGKIPSDYEVLVEPLSGIERLDIYKIGSLKIEPSGEMPNWKGEMNFKISSTSSENTKQAWVKLKIKWFAEAWVAKSNIRPFESLSVAQFKKIKAEVTNIREDLVLAENDEALQKLLKSGRAKRTIYSQAPLTAGMLDKKPDVNPGQTLKVVFVSENGLQVSADGAIIGAASVGDDVRAKLRSSKKIITGKLISQGVMEVSL